MSTKRIRKEISEFLSSNTPQVLCIRGKWGTGKTYSWQSVIKSLRGSSKAVALNEYAYVSLFGANSISDVKAAILQNTVTRDKIGDLITSDVAKERLDNLFTKAKKTVMALTTTFGAGLGQAVISGLSVFITRQIVCLDDLERKGPSLRTSDVLGYISYLQTERHCKVVILLNDEALAEDDRAQFDGYLEKVVDINLHFAPSPAECAEIALSGAEGSEELRDFVSSRTIALSIDNIRVIRKLHRFVVMIEPLMKAYKPDVLRSVASSIVLLGWCHLQPKTAPSMEFMIKRKGIFADYLEQQKGALDAREKSWQKLLQDYGYTHTDEFDLVLLKGVQAGFFEQEDIAAHAEELNLRIETGEAKDALHGAWRRLLDSFTLPVDEGLEGFAACFAKYARYYSLHDVVSVVNICRDFGRMEMSNRLFKLYVEANINVKNAFDPHDVVMFGSKLPEDIEQTLLELQQQQVPVHATDELFLLLEKNGHDIAVTERLAEIPVADYVSVLKRFEGEQFRSLRRALTQYNNLANPTDAIKTIMQTAGEALKMLADENPASAVRATGWGLIQRLPQQTEPPAEGQT